jgi:hypothetical protein
MAGTDPRDATEAPTLRTLLRTLGALHLDGSRITRPKPLLLLAFLAHEGPTDRERLARLFFAESREPRDALSTTLRRLEGFVDPVDSDRRVRARVSTDALEFQRLAVSSRPRVALERYRGAFVQTPPVTCGIEIEEWIVSTREHLGSIARDLHLEVARTELRRNRTAEAWQHAKSSILLTETFALEPEPTAWVVQRLDAAGLPVPLGWWRTLAALGFDRPRRHPSTAALGSFERPLVADEGRRRGRTSRLGSRSPHALRQRRPRRLTDRPATGRG